MDTAFCGVLAFGLPGVREWVAQVGIVSNLEVFGLSMSDACEAGRGSLNQSQIVSGEPDGD